MSSFFRKLQMSMERLMKGRNGIDNLAWAAFISAVVLNLIDGFAQTGILSFAGMALYIYCFFRMFSRNKSKRAAENRRFVNATSDVKRKSKQWFIRLKNMRKYKYFHCPQCKVLMRLSRGSGEKTIRCSKCHHEFKQKA